MYLKEHLDIFFKRLFDDTLLGDEIRDKFFRCHIEAVISGLCVFYGEQFVTEIFYFPAVSLLNGDICAVFNTIIKSGNRRGDEKGGY